MTVKMTKAEAKKGRLIPVYNLGRRKFSSANKFYYAIHVEDANGDNERCLLFTENELKKAQERAEKNPEDLPKKGWLRDLTD